jgi:phospholipid/cholesterol/gamma-HCH transport system substrate-binding protein
MNQEIIRNTRLGIFVIAGALLLIFGLYSIGKNKNVFGKSFRLISIFHDVNGLTAGNNVRYSGIDVGTVDRIEIINDSSVKIEMLIDEKVKGFIRKNCIASVGTDGIMGNKIVNIIPGTLASALVVNDDSIQTLGTVNTEEMLRTLEKTNTTISIVSGNLRQITENVSNSHGAIYKLLMDTVLSKNIDVSFNNLKNMSYNLQTTSSNLTGISNDLKDGKGTLGMVLYDTVMSSQLKIAVQNISNGSNQFNDLATNLNTTIENINSGNGIASSLINDSLLRNDLANTISNMESASIKLNEDLEGLKHSFLLKNYFRDLERQKKKSAD